MSIYDYVTDAILRPLSVHYASTNVVEVRMSAPHHITIERRDEQKKRYVEDDRLSVATLKHINTCLSNKYGLSFDPSRKPQISCVLPGGHRYECIIGSSVQSKVSLAIRCKHPYQVTPEMFGLSEAVTRQIYRDVAKGKNMVISGGTNTGKTTFLNMLVQSLPKDTRIVCAEDTPEIDYSKFAHDSVGLIAARGDDVPGMSSWSGIADHMNRTTRDWVIYGEISTRNAQSAIAAMNSGARGVLCSIHASSPELALDHKFGQNLSLGGTPIDNVGEILRHVVDLVIQIDKVDAKRKVVAVYDVKSDAYLFKSGNTQ